MCIPSVVIMVFLLPGLGHPSLHQGVTPGFPPAMGGALPSAYQFARDPQSGQLVVIPSEHLPHFGKDMSISLRRGSGFGVGSVGMCTSRGSRSHSSRWPWACFLLHCILEMKMCSALVSHPVENPIEFGSSVRRICPWGQPRMGKPRLRESTASQMAPEVGEKDNMLSLLHFW